MAATVMPLNQLCARMHKRGYRFASLAVNPPGASADALLHASNSSRHTSSSRSTRMIMEDGPKPIPAWYVSEILWDENDKQCSRGRNGASTKT
jgi:hypothetical protein